MTIDYGYTFILICIVALVTGVTRILPYILIGSKKEAPSYISYLSTALPPAIMMILVIYCMKDAFVNLPDIPYAEIIAAVSVIALQFFLNKTFFSIFVGTVVYMVLIRI